VYFLIERSGKKPCFASFHPTPLSFAVDVSSGAAAPSPSFVTSDFHRVYRVNLDSRTFTVAMPRDECEEAVNVTIAIDVQFEQTAADYHFEPNGPCACPL